MLIPYISARSLWEFLVKFFTEFFWEIVFVIIIAILGSIYYFGRARIKKWRFGRKIKPVVKQAMLVYEEKILPDYVEAEPEIKVFEKEEDIPSELPFGYIFVPLGQEEIIWDILLTYLPVSSSLKRIRILFDESLRKSMFDILSYKLGLELGKEEIAVKFRDNALGIYPEDFKVMERLVDDGKLTYVILVEASIRFKKTGGEISSSDVEEFSTLVRKMSEIDAVVVRIGDRRASSYVKEVLKKERGVVLLARGTHVSNAVDVATQLIEKGYEMFSSDELGFTNPEIGTWYFVVPKPREKVSFMCIWLKRSKVSSKENSP